MQSHGPQDAWGHSSDLSISDSTPPGGHVSSPPWMIDQHKTFLCSTASLNVDTAEGK
jgi:hypothetical protein